MIGMFRWIRVMRQYFKILGVFGTYGWYYNQDHKCWIDSWSFVKYTKHDVWNMAKGTYLYKHMSDGELHMLLKKEGDRWD